MANKSIKRLAPDEERQLRSIQSQRRNADHLVVIPPELMVREQSFEEICDEVYGKQRHDIRKRRGSISNP